MVSEMTPTRRALAAVLGGRVDYVPPANPLAQTTAEIMRICNASWPKAHFDSKMMADLAATPYEVCGVEAARLQFDISLEAEVLGCKLDWNKPDRPPVTGPAYTSPKGYCQVDGCWIFNRLVCSWKNSLTPVNLTVPGKENIVSKFKGKDTTHT